MIVRVKMDAGKKDGRTKKRVVHLEEREMGIERGQLKTLDGSTLALMDERRWILSPK